MNKVKYCMLLAVVILQACEDKVAIELNDAPSVVVVDAWINDMDTLQHIVLTKTQPYFDASVPEGITGASVVVTDSKGNVFEFIENGAGRYEWNPAEHLFKPEVGNSYELNIIAEGQNYAARSTMNRVPPLDSIKFTYYEERNAFQPEGYYGEFLSTDLIGTGDTYWIKAFKNGKYLGRPFDMNIAYDAGFSASGKIDGLVFIQPIQSAVTPLNKELDAFEPYQVGDSLYVEIHAISNEAFTFLEELRIQTQRDGGFDEIFAEPLENIPSNIQVVNESIDSKVVGFFNVAAVSFLGKRVEN